MLSADKKLPTIGLLYLDHVLRFFDKSNFKDWPNKIETVVYHWGNDAERFIEEVKRKKIDVLIGNIPATAYEKFREIARELPHVRFIPSMDTQFANKSKENVTHFCEKYRLPIPKTHIFYEMDEAKAFMRTATFPKIIKRSYGPSNYGGYYVHKVDSEAEALELLAEKHYYPVYMQDFVPMKADIRIMLIGHKPVCAFWRRPPEGEWLTNTSQGGSMDYMNVPEEALEVAARASKAANAEYWACDIAVSFDNEYRILECATAFAAFPYIRDWIGQYLMWKLSDGRIPCPHIPMYNWEELGKISSTVLRTMRNITFSQHQDIQTITDTCENFQALDDDGYPMLNTRNKSAEEWPSEIWNRQDNYAASSIAGSHSSVVGSHKESLKLMSVAEQFLRQQEQASDTGIEEASTPALVHSQVVLPKVVIKKVKTEVPTFALTESGMVELLADARGVSKNLAKLIMAKFGLPGVIDALQNDPQLLTQVKNIKVKRLTNIMKRWELHLKTC